MKTSETYVSTDAYQAARNFYQIILNIIFLPHSLCVGAMEHITIRWLLKDKKYSLIQYADELADLLIDSLRKTDLGISKTMVPTSK